MEKKVWIVIIALILAFGTTAGVASLNHWQFNLQKADDATNYETLKEVEDTCRAMVASYTADKLAYETYAASDSAEQQSWATQAKIRANNTAARYNEYILKNSFVFDGNIPDDIAEELEYLD